MYMIYHTDLLFCIMLSKAVCWCYCTG